MSSEQVQAIIPAGGIGKRMKNQQPKQFLTLDGQPILCITLRALAESKQISKFIVPSVDIVYTRRIIASYCPNIEVEVIKGGSTRQESVYNGLQTIINSGTEPNYVLVHDAVRALIRAETVKAVIDAAKKYGSATAANQVTDTLKLAYEGNGHEFIRKNGSRDFM